MATLLRRAKPMLGTVVMMHLVDAGGGDTAECRVRLSNAADSAFASIFAIERAMSAHHSDSDLGRMASAAPGATLTLDPHTIAVIRLARYWHALSRGAFDPCKAAARLAGVNGRPAAGDESGCKGTLRDLEILSATEVCLERPVSLDLGGIAKGYAVDIAIDTLRRLGVESALVNAGGDMRAIGTHAWPVEVRGRAGFRGIAPHAFRRTRNSAVASSEAQGPTAEFVRTLPRVRAVTPWSSCTVMARDCVTADALTKWGLQSAEDSSRLRRALRQHKARLWRS
ncbi:thiamine biosynthesis lipoprotein [Variovorax sp. HW608]|uniref:FAD:protein FMN transferase n=1 Tax=Variovorax sp. HW608 TaxID=1034889 RepID=UPI00081FB73F|nr:FAD:protein FMN transferase [Variovorax sp. HW608]SCK26924.1 thiamine biosynthesis lipoprotein [Variovorax sp. HW608]